MMIWRANSSRSISAFLALALLLSLFVWGGGTVAARQDPGTGNVYALTNSFVKNEVVIYDRAANGALTEAGRVDTGGIGTNVFESSTGMLLLGSAAGQSSPIDLGGGSDLLFAANAGSDNISVFQVTATGLRLVEMEPSGGERPISLTVRNGLLYVLNSGGTLTGAGLCNAGAPTITGFRVSADGQLTPIPNSTRLLSGGISAGCTQVSFNPTGNVLIVTEWVGNRIDSFTIGADGTPSGPTVNQPAGATENPAGSGPFGFTFDRGGRMLASQNFGQQLGLGGAASYTVGSDGRITPIGGVVHNGSTDPCWMVITPDGRFAYMQQFGPVPFANVGVKPTDRRGFTGSFRVGADGALTSLDPQAADNGPGAADLAIAGGGRFLYARNALAGTINGFRIEDDGRLTLVTTVAGLPTNGAGGAVGSGLVARDVAPGASLPGVASQSFPQTGMTVSGRFLAYWQAHGGLAIQGYPLTAPRMETLEDGKAYEVQYFERSRMEYHPENGADRDVLLGQFGRRIHPADPAAQPIAGQTYFKETGHNVGGRFLDYWQVTGDMADFGFPITEPFMETIDGKAYTVQYFERARFEWHPENPAPYDVLLGQFGRQILAQVDGMR